MARCPYCSNENQENALVCTYCGRALTAAQPAYPQALTPVVEASQPMQYGDPNYQARQQFEAALQRYVAYGYEIQARMDTSAVLSKKAPINWVWMTLLILFFLPGVILYTATRKDYKASLEVSPGGILAETGGTIEKYERDKKNSLLVSLVSLGVFMVLCVLFVALSVVALT